MPEIKTHSLTMTNGALEALRSVLASPGWYTTTADAYRAGMILELPEFDITAPKDADAAELWRNAAVEVELTEKQRETAKTCVQYYFCKGAFIINRHSMAMMRELGLAPEE